GGGRRRAQVAERPAARGAQARRRAHRAAGGVCRSCLCRDRDRIERGPRRGAPAEDLGERDGGDRSQKRRPRTSLAQLGRGGPGERLPAGAARVRARGAHAVHRRMAGGGCLARAGGGCERGGRERVLVASVAGSRVDRMLAAAARGAAVPARFVTVPRRAAGVTVGYLEPWRLGVDRFVAAVGAHHLFKGVATCVVGVGTAMTIDLITAAGLQCGGVIIPAPGLMVDTLLSSTHGI